MQGGQIQFAMLTNTVCKVAKYIFQCGQIQFARRTSTLCKVGKCILQGGQTHFESVSSVCDIDVFEFSAYILNDISIVTFDAKIVQKISAVMMKFHHRNSKKS